MFSFSTLEKMSRVCLSQVLLSGVLLYYSQSRGENGFAAAQNWVGH